jgi:hypothetical protein
MGTQSRRSADEITESAPCGRVRLGAQAAEAQRPGASRRVGNETHLLFLQCQFVDLARFMRSSVCADPVQDAGGVHHHTVRTEPSRETMNDLFDSLRIDLEYATRAVDTTRPRIRFPPACSDLPGRRLAASPPQWRRLSRSTARLALCANCVRPSFIFAIRASSSAGLFHFLCDALLALTI